MIFEALNDAMKRGELLLVDAGMCRFHKRRDGVVTIHEIIVLPRRQRHRIGRWMVAKVQGETNAIMLVAKCPEDLPANGFWKAIGFELDRVEQGKNRRINVWIRHASSTALTAIPPSHESLSSADGSTGRVFLPLSTSESTLPIRTGETPTARDT